MFAPHEKPSFEGFLLRLGYRETPGVGMTPEIRYAKNGEIAIGYTVVGEGRPVDLVYVSPFNNLETV